MPVSYGKEGIACMDVDDKDRALLNLLQENFPISSRPFLEIGRRLDMDEEEVLMRVTKLKKNGYIRRMSGIFDSKKLGYVSTLCALQVPEERIGEVAELMNGYKGITHNYIRKHRYNMWFTLMEPTYDRIAETLEEIKVKTGINDMRHFPAVEVFKIKVNFHMNGGGRFAKPAG